MAEKKDMSSSFLMRTSKSQLTAEKPLTEKKKKNPGTYQKRYPTSKHTAAGTMRQEEGTPS